MSRSLAFLALLLVVLYGSYKAIPLLKGPSILLTSPTANQSVSQNTVLISGVTTHTENLMLNGSLLPIDAKGRFEKTLTIASGGAILSLTATDRFGKSVSISRSVFIP
jgi:Glucodextranase, domain B